MDGRLNGQSIVNGHWSKGRTKDKKRKFQTSNFTLDTLFAIVLLAILENLPSSLSKIQYHAPGFFTNVEVTDDYQRQAILSDHLKGSA